MPKVGDKDFAYTPEGIAEAEVYSAETGIPIFDAPDRVQNYQYGGQVVKPMVGYKKGGEVKK